MKQKKSDILAIAFACPAATAVNDIVEITGSKAVTKLAATGSVKTVGVVVKHELNALDCTVETRFRERRDDRVAGAALAVGPIVFGAANKVYGYTPAVQARHDGTATGVKTYVLDTSDKLKLKLEGGNSQTITITAGVGRTMASVAAEVNATLTDMRLVVDSTDHMDLEALDIFKSVEIEAVTHDAYTLLGWTAAVYKPTAPSHDPAMIGGLAITPATDPDDVVETLEY